MKMKDVFSVTGLKKNLLSISALDAKGIRLSFVYGQVLMCPKGKTIDGASHWRERGRIIQSKGPTRTSLSP